MERTKREELRRYFAERPELRVVSLYLFGSHAEGRAHRESDIDLAALLDWQGYPTRRERFDARVRLGSELIHVLRHNEVDLVILNDVPPLFGRRIVTEGVRLFLGDPGVDEAYLVDIQLRAADLAPWIRRMEKLKLEALAG
jgi:predicted nucleotidyltransferase